MLVECDGPDEPLRYEIRREPSGRWTVVDSMTALPAASDGRDLVGLSREDARDIAEELNRSIAQGRDPLL